MSDVKYKYDNKIIKWTVGPIVVVVFFVWLICSELIYQLKRLVRRHG